MVFIPDPQIRRFGIPQRKIGVSDKKYSIFLSNFLTLLVKGGGGGGGGGGVIKYELQTCRFTSIKLPRYVTMIIRMCRQSRN